MLSFLSYLIPIILIGKILNEIKREIIFIQNKIGVAIKTSKVKAHQDKKMKWTELLFLDVVNTICDRKVKALITMSRNTTKPFLFKLLLPFLIGNNQILPTKELIKRYIILQIIWPYFTKRYHYDLDIIEWKYRVRIFNNIPKYIY